MNKLSELCVKLLPDTNLSNKKYKYLLIRLHTPLKLAEKSARIDSTGGLADEINPNWAQGSNFPPHACS